LGGDEACEEAEDGGFTAAVEAEKHVEGAVRDVESEIVEDLFWGGCGGCWEGIVDV